MAIKPPTVDTQRARTIVDKFEKLQDALNEFEKAYPYHKAFLNEHYGGILELGEYSRDKRMQLLARIANLAIASPEWRHLLAATINETNRILNEIEGKEKLNEAAKFALSSKRTDSGGS